MSTTMTRPSPSPLSNLITATTSPLPHPMSTFLALPIEILHNLQYQHSWTALELHYIHPQTHKFQPLSISKSQSSSHPHFPTSIPTSATQFLISGLPPRHAYIHPDLQTRLLKEGLTQKDVVVQREWVVPLTLGQKPSLEWLVGFFDALPKREAVVLGGARRSMERDGDGEGDDYDDGKGEGEDGATLRDGVYGEGQGHSEEKSTILRERSSLSQVQSQRNESLLEAGAVTKSASNGTSVVEGLEYPNPKRVLLAMKAHDGLGGDGTVAYYICAEGEVKPRQNG